MIGLTGFTFLFINQTIGIINPNSDAGRVRATDMAFSSSSFVFALIAYFQTIVYPSDASLRSTNLCVSIVFGFFIVALFLEYGVGLRMENYAFDLSIV